MEIDKNLKIHFSNTRSIVKMSDSKFDNLYFLDIVINNELVTVMFDTGATMTVLKESTVNMIKAETTDNSLKAGGSAGNSIEYKTVLISKILLGSNTIFDKEIIVAPDEAFDFGLDDKGNKFEAQGLLGWDIISLFKWTISKETQLITIEKSFYRDVVHNLSWNNFPLIKVNLEKQPMLLGFDSGHTDTILGMNIIDKLDKLEKVIDSTVGVDGTLNEDAYITKKFSFTIGKTSILLKNIIVLKRNIFGQACPDMMGLLGIDIIQGRKWILDYPNQIFEIID